MTNDEIKTNDEARNVVRAERQPFVIYALSFRRHSTFACLAVAQRTRVLRYLLS